jgi:hypothetical protein
MVTAELAVALPALVVVVVAAMSGIAVCTAQLRCTDAAGVAARLAARGESAALVRSLATSAAPAGSTLAVTGTADTVVATVSDRVTALGLAGFVPTFSVSARVVEAREPAGPS